MTKRPPSANKKSVVNKKTWKDFIVIGIYVLLALALVVPLFASLFQ